MNAEGSGSAGIYVVLSRFADRLKLDIEVCEVKIQLDPIEMALYLQHQGSPCICNIIHTYILLYIHLILMDGH